MAEKGTPFIVKGMFEAQVLSSHKKHHVNLCCIE
jgi:hypothetical protein